MKTPEQLRREFWQEDIAKGGWISNQYQEIHRVLDQRDFAWVSERLDELKRHAIAQTRFYRDLRPEDPFPVVDKMAILSRYDDHKAAGGFSTPLHISSTSGSTGTPFSVIQDYRKRMRNIADLKVFGERCDYPSHERMVFFRILSPRLRRTPEQEERENIYYVDSSDLGEGHLEEMMRLLLEKKPRIIFSYATTLVELAKYTARQNIDPSAFGIRSALTAGEGLSNADRELLERVFGCTAYRRYSDMELGILGQDLGDGGDYHLNWGSYYFECLKPDRDEPAGDGEVGRIVITDLYNYAFPMIRYDTGDLGIMAHFDDGRLPVLKEIYGRKRDCIYATDGALVSPAKVSVSMWGTAGIRQWQFIQQTRNQYILKLNGDRNGDYTQVLRTLREALGQDASIRLEFVDEIPVLSSHKRRAIICNYQPGKE